MNKFDFFKQAMKLGKYKEPNWVIRAFSVVKENADYYKSDKEKYHYYIVQSPTGHYFFDKETDSLVILEGCTPGQPPFGFKDQIGLKAGDIENLDKDLLSTIGDLFCNYAVVTYGFGHKMPYVEELFQIKKIEPLIAKKLKNDDEAGDDDYKVSELIRFNEGLEYLTHFTQLCVWGVTPKLLVAAPGIHEYRDKLLEENKDRLFDPSVIASIDAKLVAYDNEYLKGDPGENFLLSAKSRTIARKNKFAMLGGQVGLEDTVNVVLVRKSLSEGWELDKLTDMNNNWRAGAYNRGAETQLGGVQVKSLTRSTINVGITEKDCHTVLALPGDITDANYTKLAGRYIVEGDQTKHIVSDEDAKQYIGKYVMLRTPAYCGLKEVDFCATCGGERLGANPNAVSSALTEFGNVFLSLFLAASHAKELKTAELDFKSAIT